MEDTFKEALENLINCHSLENQSNTPDFILAKYIDECLDAFVKATNRREQWYSREPGAGRMQAL